MSITGASAAEIFDSVRQLAQARRLLPGQALPPVRELAQTLGVNRNTVAAAYKRLVGAGLALSQGRRGTIIRGPSEPGEQDGAHPGSPLIDLASGNPDPARLPDPLAIMAGRASPPRLYGEATVDPRLQAYASQWYAGDCPAAFEVDLTHGAIDAIERLLGANLAAGDTVAVEAPGFLGSINALRALGLRAEGVALDAAGMLPDALERALADGAQAVLLTPRAQNPTGASLTRARARALRQVLQRYPHVMVIADDHFAHLSASPYHSPIPAAALRWALVRSVSKALGPDLRLAFVASDPDTSRRLRLRLASGTTWVSHLLQDVVAGCLASAPVQARMAQARRAYAQRRTWLADALRAEGIAAQWPADGLNLWVPLAQDSPALLLELAHRGWRLRNGRSFGVREDVHGLRITIATLEHATARRLARDLRLCLDARDGLKKYPTLL
ncbi:transcriptional regulator PtsJ [Bordetella bronchiseptica]|uniref:MocR-like B6 salvage transcription factor PtsJ n=1 Tax=Bordetella bronchiseptica TaxID=518 RepID=UPI000444CD6E|nr:transcriptional regulator PtsJ [Bordetella bronchiseptica]AWQ10286.1 transcriptional regulator PtsJ [Bordetella bronchiseptica]AXT88936.1 transcriptional regulator PtsJ [Bordetella bronchiseptica]KDC45612.1 transcriptional regulator, GntR family [Bordetella bronchiseptica M85/00/2]KDC78587.1 transcriptional regulator, GntR family [Bordetella bronchiseptica MBORD635]KDS78475.1 GntR family transcriptional regulator [Bordetella bronchiseptica KM22]